MNKYTPQWSAMPGLVKLFLILYAVCFLAGGLRHWFDIYNSGLFPYHSLPLGFNIFLTLLSVVDVVVAILFFVRPVVALYLAVIIMIADLVVDFNASYFYWHLGLMENVRLQMLVGFGLFVFVSAPVLVRWVKNNKS